MRNAAECVRNDLAFDLELARIRDVRVETSAAEKIAASSPTIARRLLDGNRCGVNLIPHTIQATTFGVKRAGDKVNIEVDLIARYVERLRSAGGEP